MRLVLFTALTSALVASAHAAPLPAPASPQYCITVQQLLADTKLVGQNTVFTDMPEYRHSKPMVNPLRIYQTVTYAGQRPIVVHCKVKTAAHLRAAFGAKAAGEQRFCPAITRRTRDEAVAQLKAAGNPQAAARAAAFVVDDDEPYLTGQAYLEDFQISYRSNDGKVHIRAPGLYQNYDSWITPLLPEIVQGQSYCHLATVEYLAALATGAMQPGTTITSADDAPVTPR
jgi:hypothetical protein